MWRLILFCFVCGASLGWWIAWLQWECVKDYQPFCDTEDFAEPKD